MRNCRDLSVNNRWRLTCSFQSRPFYSMPISSVGAIFKNREIPQHYFLKIIFEHASTA